MHSKWAVGLLALMVALQVVMSTARVFQVPMWSGYHHERDTYRVARFLAQEGRFPTPQDYPPNMFEIQQGSQPPLYALLMAPLVGALDDGMSLDVPYNPQPYCIGGGELLTALETNGNYNPPYNGTVRGAYAVRLLNTFLVSAAALLTYAAAVTFFPQARAVGLVAAAFIAWEPYHMWIGSRIINDSLLLTVAAAFVYASARVMRAPRLRVWDGVLLMAVAVAAVTSKLSGWVILALAVLQIAWRVAKPLLRRPTRRQVWSALLLLALLAGLIGGLAGYNQATTGSVWGRYSNLERIALDLLASLPKLPRTVLPTLQNTLYDYVSAPSYDADLGARFARLYTLGTLTLLAASAGGVLVLGVRRQWEQVRVIGWLSLLIGGGTLLVILRNHIAQSGDVFQEAFLYAPLRYYVTVTPALAIVLSLSLAAYLPQRWAALHPLGVGVALAWLSVSGLVVLTDTPTRMINEARVSLPEWVAMQDGLRVPSGVSIPAVLGYDAQAEAGALHVDLYMTHDTANSTYYAALDLTDANGQTINCEFVPVRGHYPIARWQPHEMIHEPLTVNNCGAPLSAPIAMQVRWLDSATGETKHTQALGTYAQDVGQSSACPPNLGRVAEHLQVLKVSLPPTARVGTQLDPLTDYLVLAQPLPLENRIYTLEQGDTVYSCRNLLNIHGNTLTFNEARRTTGRGQRIYLDGCTVPIPSDAPLGRYTVYVQFTTTDEQPVPLFDSAGNTLSNNKLPLAEVEITR